MPELEPEPEIWIPAPQLCCILPNNSQRWSAPL